MPASWSSRIPQIIQGSHAKAAIAVHKTGLAVEAGAKERARVDTGAMRNAIGWQPEDDLSGAVVAGVEYTIYNEYGTRSMSAQPMLVPAAEDARPGFLAALAAIWQ